MIVNMACPSCGGQSTEYDEHKWTCLKCGNKFIYAPVSPPQTQNYVQNTVNVVGQPTYELDVQNAKPAKPILKTRFEHSPGQFDDFSTPDKFLSAESKTRAALDLNIWGSYGDFEAQASKAKSQNENSKIIWLFWSILFSVITVIGITNKSWLIICILPTIVSVLNLCIRHWRDAFKLRPLLQELELSKRQVEQEKAVLEQKKKEKIIIGYQPICPFCMADIANPSSGLTHCLKCGKQFHYSNERSYPVRFKSR